MKRIKSIDTVRGIAMWIMIYGHIIVWWLRPEDVWLTNWLYAFLQPIGATGFLLVSGISTALAFKNNQQKTKVSNKISMLTIRNVFFIRAMLILMIAIVFNIFDAILYGGNISDIWSWLVLQTIGFSLLLSWFFLKRSRIFRGILGIVLIIGNQLILLGLRLYEGELNFYGVLFHILFNPLSQYVILTYFGIFIIGTVIGDFIYEINIIDDQNERKVLFKNFLKYSSLMGILIMFIGIIFQFPNFLDFNTFSSVFYAVGLILTVLSGLMAIEVLEIIKTKKSYRFFFFYSYYSFTIYLTHNLLVFLFLKQLNATFTIWVAIVIGNILLGLLFRTTYKTLGSKASLKTGLSILGFIIATKIEKRKD